MSGPTTALFGLDTVAILLAAAAIQANRAVQAGYAEAAAAAERQADRQAANRAAQSEAAAAGQAALAARIAAAEEEHARLCALTAPYGLAEALAGNKPAAPAGVSPITRAAYLEQLLARNAHLGAALDGILATLPETPAAGLSDAILVASETLPPAAEAVREAPVPQAVAARLIARLAGLGSLPPAIEALEAELAVAASPERRELLEVELRRAIQDYQRRAAEKASALVLEHTLRELGYQVEPIAETLFMEGGVAHFRRAGWGDYQVRLRLDAAGKSVNFNVVRAVDAGDNERSVLDHVAEDRWCAEFPALLRALGERGLDLEVTRRLAAGELPVQLVERSRLPRFADAEEIRPQRAPLARELG